MNALLWRSFMGRTFFFIWNLTRNLEPPIPKFKFTQRRPALEIESRSQSDNLTWGMAVDGGIAGVCGCITITTTVLDLYDCLELMLCPPAAN